LRIAPIPAGIKPRPDPSALQIRRPVRPDGGDPWGFGRPVSIRASNRAQFARQDGVLVLLAGRLGDRVHRVGVLGVVLDCVGMNVVFGSQAF